MDINKFIEKTYKGRKVFITGHTGFKGSWLTLWLQILGAKIKGYSLQPEGNKSLYLSLEKNIECESVISDIRNKKKLESEILNFKPDFIFHLAAKSLVRYSYLHPLETIETNVNGTANILSSLSKLKNFCNVVIITTDKVYENKEWIYPYREVDALGGYDPYSASKACAEIITSSMRSSFFNMKNFKSHQKAISTARAGNVIGGGDYSTDRIIPDIIRAFKKNTPVVLRNPESTRPWQYVLDPLHGYLLLSAKMNEEPEKYSGAYNFGPLSDDNLKVKELVKIAIRYWGKGSFKLKKNRNEPHEAELLKLDITKAKENLNWIPVLNSSESISETINWYKDSEKKTTNIFSLTEKYLNDFINKIGKRE